MKQQGNKCSYLIGNGRGYVKRIYRVRFQDMTMISPMLKLHLDLVHDVGRVSKQFHDEDIKQIILTEFSGRTEQSIRDDFIKACERRDCVAYFPSIL
jgi:hypothetical protein